MADASRITPWHVAPTLADIEEIARDALATLPADFARLVTDVVLHVEDFPAPEVERDLELPSPFDILGLYHGVSIKDKTFDHVAHDIDRIFLYRRPILDYWCESGEDLAHIVRHVMIHEIGHHFGFSDADMEVIESQSAPLNQDDGR